MAQKNKKLFSSSSSSLTIHHVRSNQVSSALNAAHVDGSRRHRKRKWDQDDHGDASPSSKITKVVEADPSKAVSKYMQPAVDDVLSFLQNVQ